MKGKPQCDILFLHHNDALDFVIIDICEPVFHIISLENGFSPKTMSLPPATREISNKPAAGAVTEPVNKQAKDADVDRKVGL